MSSNFWDRSGITPGKGALVGVLACVLAGIVGYQFLSGAYGNKPVVPRGQATTETKFEPKRRGEIAQRTSASTAPRTESLPVEDWPTVPLHETLAHNPFATPASLIPKVPISESELIPFAQVPPKEVDDLLPVDPDQLRAHRERVRAIRELMTTGASMVMTTGDGTRVAVVNGRTIRIGDTIHGMRVTAITSEGVVLEAVSADH